MRKSQKLFYLENLGCAKNQVESERLLSFLEGYGLHYTTSPQDADWIIVNSCGFIKSACEESIELSLSFKRDFPQKKIILTGCLVLRYGESLKAALPELTIIDGRFSEQIFKQKLLRALGIKKVHFILTLDDRDYFLIPAALMSRLRMAAAIAVPTALFHQFEALCKAGPKRRY